MALSVKIKNNSKAIEKRFKRLEKKFPKLIDKGILQGGFQLLDIIRTKTQKGIDFRDRKFAPYSEGYIKQLQREGKPTAVDLFYTGRMLGALTPSMVKKTGKHKVTLAFTRKEEIDKAFFNQITTDPQRKFFGFNTRTEKIINKSFEKFVKDEIRKFKL